MDYRPFVRVPEPVGTAICRLKLQEREARHGRPVIHIVGAPAQSHVLLEVQDGRTNPKNMGMAHGPLAHEPHVQEGLV